MKNSPPKKAKDGLIGQVEELEKQLLELDRREQAIRERERRYREILDHAGDILFQTDLEGTILLANPAMQRVTGYSFEELQQRKYLDLIPDEKRVAVDLFYREQLSTKSGDTYLEFPAITKDGRRIWIGQHVQIMWKNMRPIGMQAVGRDITDIKLLRDERERVFALSTDLICTIGFDSRFLQVNPAWFRTLGYPEPGLLGSLFLGHVHPVDFDATRQALDEVRGGNELTGFQSRFLTINGSYRWFEWSATADPVRRVIVAVGRNVTDRIETQELLAKSESRFRTHATAAPIGIFEADERGRFIYVNPRWCEFAGLTFDEAMWDGWLQALHRDDRDRIAATWHQCVTERREFAMEFRFRRKDENIVWLAGRAIVMRDDEGNCSGFLGTISDVTVIRRADEDLRNSEARFRMLVRSSTLGIILVNQAGKVVLANPAAAEMFGYTEKELFDRSIEDIIPIRFRLSHIGKRERFFLNPKNRQMGADVEIFGRRKNGTELSLNVSLSVIQSGEPIAIAFLSDISGKMKTEKELHEAREAAEAAGVAKAQFLAVMSHEIRTPMNGVIGMTDLLLQTDLSERQREYVETIRQSSDALMTVISDVLDLSKVEAGRMDIEMHPFDIRECIRSAVDVFSPAARSKGLVLSTAFDADVPTGVLGDKARLRQILVNLIGNAVKFTENGSISIHVTRPGKGIPAEIRFDIRDTGIGIPADKLTSLFEPFTQADTSTTRKFGGTGLGLTISKRLTELMGGRIWAESSEGHGSLFSFCVKMEPASVPMHQATLPFSPERNSNRGKLRVLAAEDNQINQRLIVEVLKRMDIYPDLAVNGEEALRKLERATYDVVFMDVNMPVMDGLEATRRIRRTFPFKRPVIIAMTAAAMEDDRQKCLDAGMDDYISKPFRIADVQQMIEKWRDKMPEGSKNPVPVALFDPAIPSFLQTLLNESDLSFTLEFLESFLDQSRKQLDEFFEAVESGDLSRMVFSAHTLKGGSAAVGGAILSTLAQQAELHARAARSDLVETIVPDIRSAYESTAAQLSAYATQLRMGTIPF